MQVTALEKDLVSWLRRDGPIPVLLTVGFLTHSVDTRFLVDFLPPNDYRLRVSNVQWQDAGWYICQLAIHPPSLILTELQIGWYKKIVHDDEIVYISYIINS